MRRFVVVSSTESLPDFPAHLFAASPNTRPATMPVVRYHITNDLWNSFTVEQVAAQKARMIETGRWLLPNPSYS
jgi:hypothetical protein